MSAPSVRRAVAGDLDVVLEYNVNMAQESEGLALPVDVVRKGIETVLLGKTSAAYYVVEMDGRIVGQLMITYEWSDWRNCDIWWIQSVYVHPDYRKRGYFRLLYDHVRAAASEAGACGLRLYADNDNVRAQATYEKLGMTSHYKVYEDMFTSY